MAERTTRERHRFTRWLDDQVVRAAYGPVLKKHEHPTRMTTEPGPADVFDIGRRSTGLTLGVAGPVALAAALVPLRDTMSHTNAALLLVVVVVLAAILGGRLAALTAALSAAFSFDFFLTEPYYHVVMQSADDVETTIILAAVGLLVGQLMVGSARHHYAASRRRHELEALQHVLSAATGSDDERLVSTAAQELTSLLSLRNCRWNPGYHGKASPVLTRRGTFDVTAPRGEHTEAQLPRTVEIPVVGNGTELGRLIISPASETPISREERLVAIAIADILGTGLARRTTIPRGVRS